MEFPFPIIKPSTLGTPFLENFQIFRSKLETKIWWRVLQWMRLSSSDHAGSLVISVLLAEGFRLWGCNQWGMKPLIITREPLSIQIPFSRKFVNFHQLENFGSFHSLLWKLIENCVFHRFISTFTRYLCLMAESRPAALRRSELLTCTLTAWSDEDTQTPNGATEVLKSG